ncbi:MAG: formylglycine-generating enzyme family protein [Undibacterium sp.]|nr:formylglycine-generating enzyme family protein [Opitutaceae bacterium]
MKPVSCPRSAAARFFLSLLVVTLTARAAPDESEIDGKELALVRQIRERLIGGALKTETVAQPYVETIPGTAVSFSLAPVPAGAFTIGSPDTEKNRAPDEGPQAKVSLPAFWIGKYEVTWNEYEIFMFASDKADDAGKKDAAAVSHPTKPYVEMSFGMGREGFPAISMTHHAASRYCQWLSAKTGRFYRLPTEAEWEYAARAGTTTAYSFGDDPAQLAGYGVFHADKYAKVGSKKPNVWGLFDMHGNVSEWTLDHYEPDAYTRLGKSATAPWARSAQPYPHSVRGGNWSDPPELLRSAARRGSSPDWKMLDPQLPKSIWYHTSAPWIGFRVVRQLEIPSAEEMYRLWNNGVALDN